VIELLTASQMAAADRTTIDVLGVPGMVLMENAADGCARALMRRWPDLLAEGVVVVAGPGNNGGDGHVIARKLANRGVDCEVLLLADRDRVRGDARTNLDLLEHYGVPVLSVLDDEDVEAADEHLQRAGVVVDALFGTGLERDLGGRFARMVEQINRCGHAVMAVDIPSGIDATTGRVLGTAVAADLSVTFCRPKRGHYLHPGAELCGDVEVVDIGIPHGVVTAAGAEMMLVGPDVLSPLVRSRPAASHKGTYGHALIVAGSEAMPGAAVLAANAALAVGTGLVTLAVPQGAQGLLRGLVPEVIVHTLPSADGGFAADAGVGLTELMAGKTAVALGPGVGRTVATTAFVRAAVADVARPMVIDADGLRALGEPAATLSGAAGPRVLTPHPGELAGLRGRATADVNGDRVAAAAEASSALQAVCVLKGAATLIATPDGQVCLNPTGNPGMASAGTGDVLTGLLAGMMAQVRWLADDPPAAARAAAYLHGLAGDVAAAAVGEPSLRASDITDAVPAAMALVADGEAGEAFRWR